MARRIQRPDRQSLANMIRETGGNMTRLAGLLNVSKPTLYKWTYQLGLAELAGVGLSDPYGVSAISSATGDASDVETPRARKVVGNSTARNLPKLQLVASAESEAIDPQVNTSVRMRQSVWIRMRKAALDRRKPVALLLEGLVQQFLEAEEQGSKKGKAKV